jgi:hypothetical protein
MAPKACTVVVHDLNDTAHQLDVTAETLYEAVAQALATVRGHDWVGGIGKGLTTVTVKVRNPEVTHIVNSTSATSNCSASISFRFQDPFVEFQKVHLLKFTRH